MGWKKKSGKGGGSKAAKKMDRRREPRVENETGIMVEMIPDALQGQQEKLCVVIGKNISAGGMKIKYGQGFSVGTKLRLKFLSSIPGKDICTEGQIKWMRMLEEERMAEMGVEFLDISLVDFMYLLEHVYKKS
jgi:c-di-GMP-binding flagellar brake protein YcgR